MEQRERRPSLWERDLAWRMLTKDGEPGTSLDDLADALTRVFEKLCAGLVGIVGSAGFEALVGRSLRLARAEFPHLTNVRGTVQGSLFHFDGLRASMVGRSETEMREGTVAVVAWFIWLLSTFIGDGLFRQFIRPIWPDMTVGDRYSNAEDSGE